MFCQEIVKNYLRKIKFKLFVYYMCLHKNLRELVYTLVKLCAIFSVAIVNLANSDDHSFNENSYHVTYGVKCLLFIIM